MRFGSEPVRICRLRFAIQPPAVRTGCAKYRRPLFGIDGLGKGERDRIPFIGGTHAALSDIILAL